MGAGVGIHIRTDIPNRKHRWVAQQGDVTQCMDCGRWTRQGEDVLESAECDDTPDETPLAELEVRP